MNRSTWVLLVLCPCGTGSVAVAQGGPSPGRRPVAPPALVLGAGPGTVSGGDLEATGRLAVEQPWGASGGSVCPARPGSGPAIVSLAWSLGALQEYQVGMGDPRRCG